ncbi:hypothetical protein [Variovorax paradoxus]|uniref:hypothetical protein n=1 Tax=Variovorax paradoxus TaxID=34073 RepID=UPI0024813DB3|nr:hypothetical protein [Variovorax paradoxus]WGT64438.1 hypothetical protein QHG62_03620 [Variovorax paradoxus]
MSNSTKIYPHTLKEITEILIKHHGLHEGLYELAVEISIGVGAVGASADTQMPGAMMGVKSLGLRSAPASNFLTVDAAEVNPAKPARPARVAKPK